MSKKFFDEQKEQSEVKAAIVKKYFKAWATAIKNTAKKRDNKIAYLDLFAGPGRYEDGAISTPLLVLQEAINDPDLCQMLVTIFNDKDEDNSNSLQDAIDELPGVEKLKYKPQVDQFEVGTEIVKEFEKMNFVPTLFFVDPWGYKGLSLKLINSVLKDWGCECIFFFNYGRVNAGLSNDAVKKHMESLFGDKTDILRQKIDGLRPNLREFAVVEGICEALQDLGGKYTLPFGFKRRDGSRTSHHLIFVSKHPLGYKIMKEVMAKESSGTEQGVPTFEYNPSFRKQGILFELSRPLDDLEDMLLEEFAGQTITMGDIFARHNYGRRFIAANYKAALKSLETKGKITCDPAAGARKANTFADRVKCTFPKRKMG